MNDTTQSSGKLLEGKVAIISGIGPGLGTEISRALANHGADLVIFGRRSELSDELAASIRTSGRRVIALQADVNNAEDRQRVADSAREEFGVVHILVNNAAHPGNNKSLMDSTGLHTWRKAMDINFFAPAELIKLIVPLMAPTGDGRIININSLAVHRAASELGAYATSKAALEMLTRTLAVELGPQGIRVNGVHCGPIWGLTLAEHFDRLALAQGLSFQEILDQNVVSIPLGYIPDAKEIAGTVVYLSSALSRPVTGQAIGVNGGIWPR